MTFDIEGAGPSECHTHLEFFSCSSQSLGPSLVSGGPLYIHAVRHVPNSFIIQFSPGGAVAAESAVAAVGGTVHDRFTMINAFTASMTDTQASLLSRAPSSITVVEENALIETAATQHGLDVPLNTANNPATLWGLDRIDQMLPTDPRLDDSYTWCEDGTCVRAYVVDTGVRPTNADIAGRVDSATALKTILSNEPPSEPTYLNPTDCWDDSTENMKAVASHGTSVATIIGGAQLGVAKGATLVDARASDCRGVTNSTRMIRVLQWICQEDPNRAGHASVINISASTLQRDAQASALNTQITATVDTYNIPIVTAAGNFADNAFWYYPGNSDRVINVGGLAQNSDSVWSYSNYGFNIEFYAPAQYVESGSIILAAPPSVPRDQYRSETVDCGTYTADTCTSGTSFSAPHVTGVIARYRQLHPADGRDTIVNALKQRVISNGGPYAYESQTGASVPILIYVECAQ